MKDASEGTARAAVEAANSALAEYQRIRTWIAWPEFDFPRTATGKPRLSLIAAWANETLGATKSDVAKGVLKNASNDVGADYSPHFSASTAALHELLDRFSRPSAAASRSAGHLEKDLNLSSLDRVELLSALETKFHVELNETAFSAAKTVADVERLLQLPISSPVEYVYPRWTQREPVRWLRLLVYYALVWPATQMLGHPRIVGRENLRGILGPVLVVSNHITRRADIGLILAALPRRFRHRLAIAMGGETLQDMRHAPRNWFFAKRWAYHLGYWLVTALFNVFPLPQFSGFRESFRFAGESADRGFSILVFPEGVVNDSTTGEMAPFQSGIGLLSENLRIPIIPMRLDGVWKMKRAHRRLASLNEITVRIGAPVTFTSDTPAAEIAAQLQSLVRSL